MVDRFVSSHIYIGACITPDSLRLFIDYGCSFAKIKMKLSHTTIDK